MDLTNVLKSETTYGSAPPMSDPMYIAFGIDANFIKPMGVAMTSILENNDGVEFHVFSDTLPSDDDAARFTRTMDKHGARCVWHVIDAAALNGLPVVGWSHAIYYRFIAAEYFYGKSLRFLYLDGDIVCLSDLRELYGAQWEGGATIAAATDIAVTADHLGYADKYFNTGVLLIDVNAWHDCDIIHRTLDALTANPQRYKWPDQDALNELYRGHVHWLPQRWNYPNNIDGVFPTGTAIVHLISTGAKPWQPWCVIDGRDIYREVYERSEWADLPLLIPVRTTRECRFMARACWRRGQHIQAATWYWQYLCRKLTGRK